MQSMSEEKVNVSEQTIFDTIRSRCRQVAEQARHVHIAVDRIPKAIAPLLGKSLTVPTLDTTSLFVGAAEVTAAFFITLAAVNFGSGYFPHLRKQPAMSGYYTIATSLSERFRSQGPLTATQLAEVTARDCADLFQQDVSDSAIAELMTLFAIAWNDLGRVLVARHEGDFSKLIAAADHSTARLVTDLAGQPLFHDVSSYHGDDIPFYKRSQLLASDLSLAFDGHGLGRFDDLDSLTLFADNLVPHVLRLEGILEYSAPLIRDIEAETLIPAGSDQEIEIRACSIHAVELLIECAAQSGVNWTARDVDQVLWHQGQHPRYKTRGRRHRTRTPFY